MHPLSNGSRPQDSCPSDLRAALYDERSRWIIPMAPISHAMLLLRPDALAGTMLLRAMVRAEVHPAGEPVLIIFGSTTPIVPTSNSAQLAARLTNAGATIRTRALPTGRRAVADGFCQMPRLVESSRSLPCRRPIIDHYATENSPLHSLHAREILSRKGIPAQTRKAHQAIGPDVRC